MGRSEVATRSVRDREVVGSTPTAPTNMSEKGGHMKRVDDALSWLAELAANGRTVNDGHGEALSAKADECAAVLKGVVADLLVRERDCDAYRKTLQNIMQVLGPEVPTDVDYTVLGNAAGLQAEQQMALDYLRQAGIEYRRGGSPGDVGKR